MSKSLFWTLMGLGGALVVIAVAVMMLANPAAPPNTDPAKSNGEQTTETSPSATIPYAVVGDWEGQLAVFRSGNPSPDEVYDVFVAGLPSTEQSALAEGIAVYSEVELQRLLEDYTG